LRARIDWHQNGSCRQDGSNALRWKPLVLLAKSFDIQFLGDGFDGEYLFSLMF